MSANFFPDGISDISIVYDGSCSSGTVAAIGPDGTSPADLNEGVTRGSPRKINMCYTGSGAACSSTDCLESATNLMKKIGGSKKLMTDFYFVSNSTDCGYGGMDDTDPHKNVVNTNLYAFDSNTLNSGATGADPDDGINVNTCFRKGNSGIPIASVTFVSSTDDCVPTSMGEIVAADPMDVNLGAGGDSLFACKHYPITSTDLKSQCCAAPPSSSLDEDQCKLLLGGNYWDNSDTCKSEQVDVQQSNNTTTTTPPPGKSKSMTTVYIIIGVGGFVLLLVLIIVAVKAKGKGGMNMQELMEAKMLAD